MAGHSKWSNIKHKKGKADAARGKVFSKLSKEITVAAKLGGGDPDMNARLRLAIANAKAQSMPKNNIENAIKKGTGAGEGEDYFEIRYEGYAPGGVAIIVECLTDNKNRSAGEVRTCFSKGGGNMGETGSVGFMFDRVGEIIYPADKAEADTMFEMAVEAGAMNVESDEDYHVITTADDDFAAVNEALEQKFGAAEKAGLIWQANINADVTEDQAASVLKLIEALEDCDDVQNVYSNLNIDDAMMEKLAAAG
jgi:YebC/PmpR family DNA-binding regulatory protein